MLYTGIMMVSADRNPAHLVGVAAALMLVCFVASVFAIETLALPPAGRIAAALLPAGALALFLVAEIRALRSLDEMQRRIHLEALAIAYPVGLVLVFTLGSLERAGFHVRFFENPRDLWPLLVMPYAVGFLFAWRRYR
jgi:hypothetical protein